MEAYLDKILDPDVLITLFAVFVLARVLPRGSKSDTPAAGQVPPAQVEAALERVTLSKWLEIDAELDARKKIKAIKLLRGITGLGLKDAKDAIDARQRQRDLRPR